MLVNFFFSILGNSRRILNTDGAVYAIEATVHAPTWEGVYDEIRKVLKPGGVVSLFPSVPKSSIPNKSFSLVSTNGACQMNGIRRTLCIKR